MIHELTTLLEKEQLQPDTLQVKKNTLAEKLFELQEKQDFSSDIYISTSKEQADIHTLQEKVQRAQTLVAEYKDTQEMLEQPDMAELATEELKQLENEAVELHQFFEEALATPLPHDAKQAIFEIRPGVGGVEASLFAEDLYKMYLRYCSSQDFSIEQYSLEYDDQGGIKEASFLVKAPASFKYFRFESGVHRVQRVPVTESSGRIHTSTASVVVLPKFEQKDVAISQEDLRIDVYRASGPGGQSVNTTDSAVRITHIPTGIVVSCQNGKSQHKNKDMAMQVLASKLYEIEEEKRLKQEKDMRSASILGGDRSVKIRTYNFQQGRITDHRITTSWYNLDQALQGDIDEIVKITNAELRKQIENN